MNKALYILIILLMLGLLVVVGYLVYQTQFSEPAPAALATTENGMDQPEIFDQVAEPAPAATIPPAEPPPADTATQADSAAQGENSEAPMAATPTVAPEAAPAEPSQVPPGMALVPAGVYLLGSDEAEAKDGPVQVMALPAFAIDQFEVTNADFARFTETTGYVTYAESAGNQSWRQFAANRDNHPVVKVTWHDAVAYCEWANKRLPTEFEWEAAARGSDGRIYPWGNDFNGLRANVKASGLRRTAPVGSYPDGGSPFGVQDMGGNVWEWTASWFQPYPGNTTSNPYFGERFRVTRGGAWFEEASQVTTFNRNAADPLITANDDVGFRCVQDVR